MNTNKTEENNTQSCQTAVISRYVEDLRAKWNPKKESRTGFHYHGTKSGESFEYEVYFDNYECEWASKENAFKGFVFQNIEKFL